MAGKRVHIVLDQRLLTQVDQARGRFQSRGSFVREALEQALGAATEVRHSSARGDIRGDSPPAADSPRTPASARAPEPPQTDSIATADRLLKELDRGPIIREPDRPASRRASSAALDRQALLNKAKGL